MVKAKKNQGSNSGLGKAIIRKRFGSNRPVDGDTTLHTTELDDGPSWTKLQSVTQEGDLEAFIHNAELAGTEFTAEKLNIQIVTNESGFKNPFLLTAEQEAEMLARHQQLKDQLSVPRRPHWDSTTTAQELQQAERESFLDWRRSLALLQERDNLLLTPYERNLEVWRQLWRVIERSDLIVQIVDARNPLAFYSEDLGTYVNEVDERKKNLLLVNKADMLTAEQRTAWADYFDEHGIRFSFFSAALAKRANDEEALRAATDEVEALELKLKLALHESESLLLSQENLQTDADLKGGRRSGAGKDGDSRIDILTTSDLYDLFTTECPIASSATDDDDDDDEDEAQSSETLQRPPHKLTIGLVGYPNVGKSSTINALCGAKRVSVSATPGKTKHFQTIHLTPDVLLCDCPGLVFPSFATTKAEMVCNGVLPIDQLRESSGPATLVAQRLPKHVLESIYGIIIKLYDDKEDGRTVPTGEELCKAYALARGYMTSGQGNPDQSRAARYLLKDYVKGKLLFVHPPPTVAHTHEEALAFNAQLHNKLLQLSKRVIAAPKQQKQSAISRMPSSSASGQSVDRDFFGQSTVRAGIKGKFGTADFARTAMGAPIAIGSATPADSGKKRHKKGKRHVKVRVAVRDE
ncbi:hypothetical protein RI367_001461 [Sorochytrium milnesiophthora]